MGNAASTDGAAAGAASAGAGGSGGGGDASNANPGLAPENPGFARVQGVTAARADGRTKPRGPPAPASQYPFLQVRARVEK